MNTGTASAIAAVLAGLIAAATPATAQPATAQTAEARAAQSRVQLTLERLDELMAEQARLDRERRNIEMERDRLNNLRFSIDNSRRSYNDLCRDPRFARPMCPTWLNEVKAGNARLEREIPAHERRVDALRERFDRLKDRIAQMRFELSDRVNDLAAACRPMPVADRRGVCSIPGGGRSNGRFVNEARAQLQSSL